jgi:hypothetical protein
VCSAFSGGAIEYAKKIAGANTMTFEFTPFNGNPQVAAFAAEGLRVHLPKIAEACGWIYEWNLSQC